MSEVLEKTEEIQRDHNVRGISGAISRQANSEMKYPNLEIKLGNNSTKKYKLQLLKDMMLEPSTDLYLSDREIYEVYLTTSDGKIVDCGGIYRQQIKAILKIFSDECEVVANMSKEKVIAGNYVYALTM